MVSMLVAVAVALFVLPSALNIPQANPTQTLEFAPIPPEDDEPPPPDPGNVETLSLGSSSTAPAADAPGGAGPALPSLLDGAGVRPVTKLCVGNPPRQTADPMSPPCVAHFAGDNGGSTHPGVNGEVVRVLWYFPGEKGDTSSRGTENLPASGYYDLCAAPEQAEHFWFSTLRIYQDWFNFRYQTYGRKVCFTAYMTDLDPITPEASRADAAAAVREVDPFIAVPYLLDNGPEGPFLQAIAQQDRLAFNSMTKQEAEDFYRVHRGRLWSYSPSIDQQARAFSNYVCTKVLPHPVSFSGNNGDQGQARVLGFAQTASTSRLELHHFAEVTKRRIEDCGGQFAHTITTQCASSYGCNDADNAAVDMANFAQNDVTTVIWAAGLSDIHSVAGGAINYRPEWVVADDRFMGSNTVARHQEQAAWNSAVAVSYQPLIGRLRDRPCYQPFADFAPDVPRADVEYVVCNDFYPVIRQVFTAIQVAGPNLTPESVERGFRAIPAIQNDTPAVPTCFFAPGDYTCVKDAIAMWWDAAGISPNDNRPGCWRVMEDGRRHLFDRWPEGDVTAQKASSDPCNGYEFWVA